MDNLHDAPPRPEVGGVAGEQRSASLSEVAERLRDCLEELDRLKAWRAGAHVSQALTDLELEICNSL